MKKLIFFSVICCLLLSCSKDDDNSASNTSSTTGQQIGAAIQSLINGKTLTEVYVSAWSHTGGVGLSMPTPTLTFTQDILIITSGSNTYNVVLEDIGVFYIEPYNDGYQLYIIQSSK